MLSVNRSRSSYLMRGSMGMSRVFSNSIASIPASNESREWPQIQGERTRAPSTRQEGGGRWWQRRPRNTTNSAEKTHVLEIQKLCEKCALKIRPAQAESGAVDEGREGRKPTNGQPPLVLLNLEKAPRKLQLPAIERSKYPQYVTGAEAAEAPPKVGPAA
ncbi:hypothetical protein K438DRAFT_1752995 [Mycena galopus ATCC 62051]|nr:hypothetical protein K438DRAFT_1752995 [Mycena galopus ATCC 62051]